MPVTVRLRSDHVLIRVVPIPPKAAAPGRAPRPGYTDYVVAAKGPGVPALIGIGDRVILHLSRPEDYMPARTGYLIVREAQIVASLVGED